MYTVFFYMNLSDFIDKYDFIHLSKYREKSPYTYFLLGDFVEYPLVLLDVLDEFHADIKSLLSSGLIFDKYEFNLFKNFLNLAFGVSDILKLYPSDFIIDKFFIVDEYFFGLGVPYVVAVDELEISSLFSFIKDFNIVSCLSTFSSFSDLVSKAFSIQQPLYANYA